jgi:hypothetical protein
MFLWLISEKREMFLTQAGAARAIVLQREKRAGEEKPTYSILDFMVLLILEPFQSLEGRWGRA